MEQNKINLILNEIGLNPDNQGQYNKDVLWSSFQQVMDYRKALQNDFNLMVNPLKRQVKSIDNPLLKKSLNTINKQITDLEKITKKYVAELQQIEKNLFYIHNKIDPNKQYDYDNYSLGQDFDDNDGNMPDEY